MVLTPAPPASPMDSLVQHQQDVTRAPARTVSYEATRRPFQCKPRKCAAGRERRDSALCDVFSPAMYAEGDVSPVVVFNAAARTPPSNLINGDINLGTSQPSRPGI